MKKHILEACTATLMSLSACAAFATTAPELGACGARDPRNGSGAESSACIRVASRAETGGVRPAVMRTGLETPVRAELRPPARDSRAPEPGRWATLLAGLLGALAIARRRVS